MQSKKSFFVVEDHTLTNLGIQHIIKQNLKMDLAGVAFSNAEAIEKLTALALSSSLPDILILDLILGKESGIDLLKKIRENFAGVKVLVYSMYAKPGILSLALEAGAQGFVEKSASEAILLQAIGDILSGKFFVQQNLVAPLFTYRTMYDGLTRQEQKILKMILQQKTRPQIASELNIAQRTLENYLSRILSKTGCKDHEELVQKFS